MSNPQHIQYIIQAHWATERLLTQMAEEVMSDEGYAVYLRLVETRKHARKQSYSDEDVIETTAHP